MTDQGYVQAIVAVAGAVFAWRVLTKRFDPFAPVWLFLVGYLQVYAIQATTLREWALNVRGIEVVTAANFRAFWALLWFLAVYFTVPGRTAAARLPRPPMAWSVPAVLLLAPLLSVFGLYCAGLAVSVAADSSSFSAEAALLASFPFVTIVGGILLIVTGRDPLAPRPLLWLSGLAVAVLYTALWTYFGKRSPALIGILSTVCAHFVARRKRPSWPVLLATAFVGSLFVALAINWRFNRNNYERSVSGFMEYLGDFEVSSILTSLNIDNNEDELYTTKFISYESLEYGGFLLMLDTVPEKSGYDYGANYLRCVSTFVPRILWPDKPLYGRDKWVGAWIAGSEMKRDEDFAGPAIGLLGATQLNGGAVGTLIVLAVIAVVLRTGYEYFLRYESAPWVQAWWSLIYYNAWYMVVTDDPATWFYYGWGFTTMPGLVLLWLVNKMARDPAGRPCLAAGA
jgi:hypothetical protein